MWRVEKAECAGDRPEGNERVGLGEERGGGAESEHACSVRAMPSGCFTEIVCVVANRCRVILRMTFGGVEAALEVAAVFLRLGATAFGGPIAHISAMDDQCVRVRQWLTREEFADLLSVANLMPGPSSTELAMLLGARRAGALGLLVAGVSFSLPATLLVWTFAWWYGRTGSRPEVSAMLTGMQPVVVAVVAHALWRLGRQVLRTPTSIAVAAAGLVAIVLGAHELVVLGLAATAGAVLRASGDTRQREDGDESLANDSPAANNDGGKHSTISTLAMFPIVAGSAVSMSGIFAAFLKIGCLVFGSGYVLLAFLRTELVERRGWLTLPQLFDAIAIGQVTPGPVFSTATFIGYQLAGNRGALSATFGMFLPAFVFAVVSGIVVARVRRSPRAAAALDGVNAASLALMASAVLLLGRNILTSASNLAIAALAFALLRFTRISSGWVLLDGALPGFLRLPTVAQ